MVARSSAATPEVVADEGVADNAAPVPGSATAMFVADEGVADNAAPVPGSATAMSRNK